MSEQSPTQVPETPEIPQFSALDTADWGRDDSLPAEVVSPDVPRETSPDQQAIQDLARSRGWVDKPDWRGPEAKWVPADAFNERYESVLPTVQRENRKLYDENKAIKAEIAELRKEAEDWRRFRGEQEKSQRELRINTLEMELKRAFDEHDTDAFMRVQRELRQMEAGQPVTQTAPHQARGPDPEATRVMEAFLAENPVFRNDQQMGQILAEVGQGLRSMGSQLIGRDFLDEAKRQMQMRYPHLFRSASVPSRHPIAETGGAPSATRTGSGRTWNDLKPESREALDRFIQSDPEWRKNPAAAREEFVRNAQPDDFRR